MPHYLTFNHRVYNFYGEGDFYLVRTEDAQFIINNKPGVMPKNATAAKAKIVANFPILNVKVDAALAQKAVDKFQVTFDKAFYGAVAVAKTACAAETNPETKLAQFMQVFQESFDNSSAWGE